MTLKARYLDFDGDGVAEWVEIAEDGTLQVWERRGDSGATPFQPAHLLRSFSGPLGGTTSYLYEPASRVARGQRVGALVPHWLLTEVTHSQDDVGDLSFEYAGPVLEDREFRGYR